MGRAEDHEHKAKGHHDFTHETGCHRISARRMIAIAIAGEASVNIEACFPARDYIENGGASNGP